MAKQTCQHIDSVKKIKTAKALECEECIKIGSDWVHLRTCQTCGVTLCCDDSPHRHMTAHYHKIKHPVITSAQPGEHWMWCYPDELFFELQ